MDNQSPHPTLLKTGATGAAVCALAYLLALVVYVPAYRSGPPPASVLEWFGLFQRSPITGLFFLGLADLIIMLAWGPLALALHALLKRSHPTAALLALVSVLVGIAVFIAINPAFAMRSLSREYAAAAAPEDKALLLAAGKAMLAVTEGTGKLPLGWLGGVIFSAIMLRGNGFSRLTAWVGLVGFALLVASVPLAGYATTGPVSPLQVALIAITYTGGGLLSLAWYGLVGVRLWRMGERLEETSPPRSPSPSSQMR